MQQVGGSRGRGRSLVLALGLALVLLPAQDWGLWRGARAVTQELDDKFHNRNQEYFQRPGVQVSEIVRARGYLAEEHSFVSDDGYVLGLTRALNPLIGSERRRQLGARRQPLLFVHGTLVDGNSFVMNSFDVEAPQDFSRVDARRLSESQLIELFGEEPSAKSLAFFALNMGHEVWFLHKRGTPRSQRRLSEAELRKLPPAPTVMDKYLASARYNQRLRARAKESAGRREVRRLAQSEPPAAALTSQARHWASLPAGEAKSPEKRPPPPPPPPPERKETSRGKRKKSHSKLFQSVHAAPAALLDYGHFLRDLEITFDRRLWNHSLDEQAAYDLPRAVDFVLERTNHERLSVVGDSSGGALLIMALVLEPRLNSQLNKAVAWVPSFNIGHVKNNENFSLAQPLFNYLGPYPFTFVSNPIQALMEVACSLEIMQKTLCTMAVDSGWGQSLGQAPVRTEYQAAYLVPVSAHEYLQLIQMHTRKQTRMFDFRDRRKNLLAYGHADPPRYNVSLINFAHLSIYTGTADTLVTEADVETIHRELRVPHRIVTMRWPGVNHGAVLFHEQVARVVILPTYKDIVSNGYQAKSGQEVEQEEAAERPGGGGGGGHDRDHERPILERHSPVNLNQIRDA